MLITTVVLVHTCHVTNNATVIDQHFYQNFFTVLISMPVVLVLLCDDIAPLIDLHLQNMDDDHQDHKYEYQSKMINEGSIVIHSPSIIDCYN